MKRTQMFRAALERYLVSRILLQGKIVLQQVTIRPLPGPRNAPSTEGRNAPSMAGRADTHETAENEIPVSWELASLSPPQPAAVMAEIIRPIIGELQAVIDLNGEDDAAGGGNRGGGTGGGIGASGSAVGGSASIATSA